MTDLPEDETELEELFRRHEIPLRHLRPWWVKVYRRLGMHPKPPVLFSLVEHLRWEGTSIATFTTAGYLLSWWLDGTSPQVLLVFYAMAMVLPCINWLVRRRIRERLRQDTKPHRPSDG